MNSIRRIIGLTHGLTQYLVIIALLSVAGALVALATPYLIKMATDWIVSIIAGRATFDYGHLWVLLGGLFAASLTTVALSDIGGWFGDMVAVKTRRQLSQRYYEHLLRLPQQYYDAEITGTIINRLTRAIADITTFLQFFANNLLRMLLTTVITVAILGYYNIWLAVLFIVLIPLNLLLTARTSDRWQVLEKRKNKHFDIASGRFAEAVGQMRLVKSFGAESRELRSFDREVGKTIAITAEQSRWWHGMNALRGLTFGAVNIGIIGIILYETATGRFSVGDLVLLLTLVDQASFPLRNLSFFVDSYQRAVANSRDYLEALDQAPEADDTTVQLSVTHATIQFDHVDFSYELKHQVLHDVSFTIKSGSTVALVGESGGGKSTIANLLMRLYEPESGQITIDGSDIATVSRASLRQAIATVFQDPALFSGTIRENITYGRPDASDNDVEKAARAANAHGFISKLPNGYDTEIGERGVKLSGGQKQRLAIARALLKDAPILILDEATSSLDSRAEHEVQQALTRLMKGRTTLIIAHRLSTIASVDMIVTIKNGTVDEVGSPRDLATTGGIYAQLLELQTGSAEQAKKQLEQYDILAGQTE